MKLKLRMGTHLSRPQVQTEVSQTSNSSMVEHVQEGHESIATLFRTHLCDTRTKKALAVSRSAQDRSLRSTSTSLMDPASVCTPRIVNGWGAQVGQAVATHRAAGDAPPHKQIRFQILSPVPMIVPGVYVNGVLTCVALRDNS